MRIRCNQVNAASQRLKFSRQAGWYLGFRLGPFSFFLSTGTSARLSQFAQPDWDPPWITREQSCSHRRCLPAANHLL